MKNPRNVKLMAFLWIFAFALCGLVIWLMLLRGPAVTP
jgi:hypothetical protein